MIFQLTGELILGLIGTVFLLMVGALAWYFKSDREEMRGKMDGVIRHVSSLEGDINKMRVEMGHFQTRAEASNELKEALAEHKQEMRELRTFMTAWLTRVEQRLASKADRPGT